jgi:hypothetical protein
MINHKHKCIFVHIIKTGGVSIATALEMQQKQCHLSSLEIMNKMGDDVWDEYFTFAFVRNPWDKIVSQYHYNGSKWCKKYFGKVVSFEQYVVELIGKDRQYTMFEPKNLPYILDKNGDCMVDFVGKFENLQEDFNIVCDNIGKKRIKLPHKNISKHNFYTKYYNSITYEIIADKFAQDIKYFNYSFE